MRISVALIAVAIVIFLMGMCCGKTLVNKFTFFPKMGMQVDLAEIDAPVESVYLTTEDGVKVSGFYIPRQGVTSAIIFFHGNAGNASHRIPTAVGLWEMGANVLLMDYRGYGLSDGEPSEQGVYLDGEAGLRFLADEKKIPLNQIVVFGRSLGSAVAIHISQDREVAGVILAAPLSSGRDVASEQGLGCMGPSIGRPFDSHSKVAALKSPLLVFHGDRDQILPVEMGRKLYDAAVVEKEFVLVKGAGHNDLIHHNPPLFYSSVKEFLGKHTGAEQ